MMWGYGWGWTAMLWMGLGLLLWLAALGLIIWAVVRIIGSRGTFTRNMAPGGPSVLEFLQQRYARGEIDAATYEQMRERLGGGPTP